MPPRSTIRSARLQAIFNPPNIRYLHTSRPGNASLATAPPAEAPSAPLIAKPTSSTSSECSLHCLPLSTVIRTYLISSISARPLLLSTCSKIMLRILESKSTLTDIDKNPVLNFALRETFYKQFCGGENKQALREHMKKEASVGYHGVMMEYALEVLKDAGKGNELADVAVWRQGLLDSIDAARPGDYVGLKWSGLGAAALQLLKEGKEPTPAMSAAMHEVCDAAYAKTVRLLPAAEETTTLPTFHKWCLDLERKYNRGPAGSIVFSTYQAYLKKTPVDLAQHLALAKEEGFTLGVKLVRGAYLDHEARDLIWATKEETDAAYDSLTSALIHTRYEGLLHPSSSSTEWPTLNVVLATHNAASVKKAVALRTAQVQNGERLVPLIYAQLQGMADEVSCWLLAAGKGGQAVYVPQVFKLSAWGTMKQCLGYLLRRAAENKDAASRTYESRDAMRGELGRRFRAVFGLA